MPVRKGSPFGSEIDADEVASDVATQAELDAHAASELETAHPGDISAARLSFDPATQAELDGHTGLTNNPHSVTRAQLSAAAQADLDAHEADNANPHGVTAAQAGALADAPHTRTYFLYSAGEFQDTMQGRYFTVGVAGRASTPVTDYTVAAAPIAHGGTLTSLTVLIGKDQGMTGAEDGATIQPAINDVVETNLSVTIDNNHSPGDVIQDTGSINVNALDTVAPKITNIADGFTGETDVFVMLELAH